MTRTKCYTIVERVLGKVSIDFKSSHTLSKYKKENLKKVCKALDCTCEEISGVGFDISIDEKNGDLSISILFMASHLLPYNADIDTLCEILKYDVKQMSVLRTDIPDVLSLTFIIDGLWQ